MKGNIYFRKANGSLGVVTYDDPEYALELVTTPARILSDLRKIGLPKEQSPKARTAFLAVVK